MQIDKIIQHIVGELNKYRATAGLKGFVVGVSGGIDSAVTSTLSAKTGFKFPVFSVPLWWICGLFGLAPGDEDLQYASAPGEGHPR